MTLNVIYVTIITDFAFGSEEHISKMEGEDQIIKRPQKLLIIGTNLFLKNKHCPPQLLKLRIIYFL